MKDLTCIYGLRLFICSIEQNFYAFYFGLQCCDVFCSTWLKDLGKFFFFFDEATDWTWGGGARRARGARRGGSGFRKKTRLINGAGSGFRVRPAGRVRVQRNPTHTRPVAIPMSIYPEIWPIDN